MRVLFADTCYFVALCNPNDQHRENSLQVQDEIKNCTIVTSDLVLTELLNLMTNKGSHIRRFTYGFINEMRVSTAFQIIPFDTQTFWVAAKRYAEYEDKKWSLVDCYSMILMDQQGIRECITHDHHFVQAGYKAIMRR